MVVNETNLGSKLAFVSLLVWLLFSQGSCLAGTTHWAQLDNAKILYAGENFKAAIDTLTELLDLKDLPQDIQLQARVMEGRCLASDGNGEAAQGVFMSILEDQARWTISIERWREPELIALREAQRLYGEKRATAQADSLLRLNEATRVACPTTTLPILSTAGVLVAGTASIYFSSRANSLYDSYSSSQNRSPSDYEDYKKNHDLSKAAGIAAGVLTLSTVYLWLHYRSERSRCEDMRSRQARISVTPAPGGIVLSWRF